MLKSEIFLTTFQRDKLLKLGLESINCHTVPDNCKITILNDGLEETAKNISKLYGCNYIFTGHRHTNKLHWRIPGYALNIGIKRSDADIVIISCAEVFHLDNCLEPMIDLCTHSPNTLVITEGKDDRNGSFTESNYDSLHDLKTELPFLMAMRREHFMAIGGYDEDFTGQSYDDDDLVERLIDYGCHIEKVTSRCVHLYHDRNTENKRDGGRLKFNRELYNSRKGIIKRNQGKEWGCLTGEIL